MLTTIQVPISSCSRYELLASPECSDQAFNDAVRVYKDGSDPLELPLSRTTSDGRFEIYWGWFLIEAAKVAGLTKIGIRHCEASDETMLAHAITKVSQENNFNPMLLAQALATAKEHLQINDTQLAQFTGLKRSTINRLLVIQKNLIPEAYSALRNDEMGISIAKKLAAMDRSKQRAAFVHLKRNGFKWVEYQKLFGEGGGTTGGQSPARQSAPRPSIQSPQFKEKGIDQKRFEIKTSQVLGAPVSIDEYADTDGGILKIQGFSTLEIEGVIDKLKKSNIPCELRITFKSNDDLEEILGSEEG